MPLPSFGPLGTKGILTYHSSLVEATKTIMRLEHMVYEQGLREPSLFSKEKMLQGELTALLKAR